MIKYKLIKKVAEKHIELKATDIELSVDQILDRMIQALCSGERIEIRGFGSFVLRHHAPRDAHNPKTGERVVTISKYMPHFKCGKDMRERVNANRHIPIKERG